MKTKPVYKNFALTLFVLTLAVMLSDCRKKKKENPPDTSYEYVQEHNLAEAYNNDIGNIGNEASEKGSVNNYKQQGNLLVGGIDAAPCATVTLDAAAKQFTVDFGTIPCLCKDGRMRSGKLIYNYSASANGAVWPRHPGFSITCTSQNYVVDQHTVNIIQRTHQNITPTGFNPATTNLKWQVTANIQIIKPNNQGTISWAANRIKELINTSDTTVYHPSGNYPIAWNKAKLLINGQANGTTSSNEPFTVTASNLLWDATCTPDPSRPFRHPFTSGTVTFNPPNNKPARIIDFGYGGGCDFLAQVCIPDYNFCKIITLP
ncbi:MAG: hypothetical protein N3F09_03970 [Bacteroidia bacterium]|nr:hypothetical protein [Bacteroidia bacterium]